MSGKVPPPLADGSANRLAPPVGPPAPDVAHSVVHRVRYGRYVSVALILVVLALIVRAFAVGKIDWPVVGEFLFSSLMLWGIVNTIVLTACAMVLGILLGLAAALMGNSDNPVLRGTAAGYIFVFRALPALLQLLIWYNLALIFPVIWIPGIVEVATTKVITPFVGALLAFGILQGAYTSEVIRSGLLSVGKGQLDAARSIGMTQAQALRRIILPQAMRVIVPPIGNETIGMVKFTSLASVIQYKEIIYGAQAVYYANGRVIELLIVAAFWYSVVVAILTYVQSHIERHYNRSQAPVAVQEAA
ncbi:MAG: amino acid ABC transporter permease [Alphaproteobacteria bacterium]|nr:amino acid ABC transporter permease [Alphaproteobacteria bacterium]